jgi:hypothetical protein
VAKYDWVAEPASNCDVTTGPNLETKALNACLFKTPCPFKTPFSKKNRGHKSTLRILNKARNGPQTTQI